MEFNPDGSLKIEGKTHSDLELFEEKSPHQIVLALIAELPFPIGRKFLAEVLQGKETDKVKKCCMDSCENYGALDLYHAKDIYDIIDSLLFDGLIEITKTRSSKYYPVITLTPAGAEELKNPKKTTKAFSPKKDVLSFATEITEKDRQIFDAFGNFLEKYNDEQKKAIIDTAKHILCIAGAGSGKTTVLTKRIEFLVKMRGVNPKSILAITFTRKARQEMISRLSGIDVRVETFNSFCEQILRKHGREFYGREMDVLDFSKKIRIVSEALRKLGYTSSMAVDRYFSSMRKKDERTLFFNLVNDVFSLIDHYKNNKRDIRHFKEAITHQSNSRDKPAALFVYNLIKEIEELQKKHGLRDYTDQIVHALELFRTRDDLMPRYEHILVDEYQDVNDLQVDLLDVLDPDNLFVVGDPRQSIYGWRGSKLKNILIFPEKYDDVSVVQLTKNYRSSQDIVDLSNKLIKPLQFPDLKSGKLGDVSAGSPKQHLLIRHKNENAEALFVAQSIIAQNIARNKIFVLARTNGHLDKISDVFDMHGISYLKKTAAETDATEPAEDQVTLSTVHAIKGLEAEVVYVMGVNTKMFPCLVSDHPVQDLAKLDYEYDKQEEELRLLYVAMTRARSTLVMNYTGNLSKYVTKEMKKIFSQVENGGVKKDDSMLQRLKDWRMRIARESNLLPYMVVPDRVFFSLIEKQPTSIAQLHDISGLGPTKIMKYGEELLDILNGF